MVLSQLGGNDCESPAVLGNEAHFTHGGGADEAISAAVPQHV